LGFSENKHKIVAFLLLFLVMVGIAAAMYLKSQGLEIKNISVMEFLSDIASTNDNKVIKGNDYVVNYDAKEHPTFGIYKDLVIKCTRDYLTALNKKGEEQWKIPVLLNKPLIKTAGQDLLVADIGGRDVYVIKGRNIKWEIKTDDNIINADISESGHVTVVQEQKGYKAKVITYDSNGMDIFTRNIVESFVVSAMVSPSGKQVLINGLDVSGVNATTTFEFTDILGNPFAAKVPMQNEIFPSVWYFSDNSVASVGHNPAGDGGMRSEAG
jgi:hypothetical protein